MRRCGHRQKRYRAEDKTIRCTAEALDRIEYCDEHARAKRERYAAEVQRLTRAIMLAATGGRHGA